MQLFIVFFLERIGFFPDEPDARRIKVSRSASGEVRLQISGVAGKSYMLEGSSDLANWTVIRSLTLESGTLEFVAAEGKETTARFYRVRVP